MNQMNLSRRTLFWKTPIGMPPKETTFTVYQNWLWLWVLWFSNCEQDICVVYINLQMLVQILNVYYKTNSLSFKKEYLGWRRGASCILLSDIEKKPPFKYTGDSPKHPSWLIGINVHSRERTIPFTKTINLTRISNACIFYHLSLLLWKTVLNTSIYLGDKRHGCWFRSQYESCCSWYAIGHLLSLNVQHGYYSDSSEIQIP